MKLVDVLGIFHAKEIQELRIHELTLERADDCRFDFVLPHSEMIGAGAFVEPGGTCVPALIVLAEAPAADSALDQTREKIAWTLRAPKLLSGPLENLLALLHLIPQLLVDNAKFGHLAHHTFILGVHARNAPERIRLLVFARAVPLDDADIHFVVQETERAPLAAIDRALTPELVRRRRNAFLVEFDRDRARGFAGGVIPEDTAHHFGLGLIDRALAAYGLAAAVELLDHLVAVCEASRHLALFDAPALSALAVKRFDRTHEGAAAHIEDFAQVFGVYPEDKYRKASYCNIAEVLWAEAGENAIAEFVRRLVFNALIGNADMHLKNWSLIYPDERRAALSPAYDLVSTIAYLADDNMALNSFSAQSDSPNSRSTS